MTSPVSPRAGRRASGAIRRMPQLASVLTPRTGVKALAGAGLGLGKREFAVVIGVRRRKVFG